MRAVLEIPHVVTGATLEKKQRRHLQENAEWSFEVCRGRTVELHSGGNEATGAAALTFAFGLLKDAQRLGEPCAWICATKSLFYPPDVTANGVDLDALPIVMAAQANDAARCAERLLKSGGFGCVVLDLGPDPWFANALQARLAHHARAQHATVLYLIEDLEMQFEERSLGPKTGLRLEAVRKEENAPFRYVLHATKDNQNGHWTHSTARYGTAGLR